ncbi:ABC transporter ATP-binding protein [Psittacicella melopsittaci]|uniref:ABC transporter ATP-binding protein n=1 Tax=Psittacicella melopsittaci TaxID=2028576 RepID=A0A3A1Y352_9GAMM|nr:ATP-binding cassette domain-containing protein [Psittacicella melopsittaci]RIY31666.1 ABC transporter ATP-binding protein [Psittacicella melopsittaci]
MSATNNNIVEVKGIDFSRGSNKIYSNLTMNFAKGKITAVMGPSGIGKTTLLKLIGGQLIPDKGDILFNGESISFASTKDLYDMRKNMGMLFQSATLFNDMSVFDNVAYALREHTDLSEEMIRMIVLMKLQAVGLRGTHELFPSELSGGMQRRVALARAVSLDPELIMYDEPFAGQDPISFGVIVKLIKDLNQTAGLTSIVVTHDIQEVLTIADYCYILMDGKVLFEGTAEEVKACKDPYVVQFLTASSDGPISFHKPAPDYQTELFAQVDKDAK